MAQTGYIHGGTDPDEVARLEKQARWCGPWILRDFDAPKGTRVLDLATGVGAMAGELLRRYPGAFVAGADLSIDQLREARKNHRDLALLRSDAARLPFLDGTFGRVHCSWLLEHLRDPLPVLREERRVLARGGYCQFTEVDNSTFRTVPEFPEVVDATYALDAAQQLGGGDPFVGLKMEGYLKAAGFTRMQVRGATLLGNATDPVFMQGFVDEFAEIFDGLTRTVPHNRLLFEAAAAKLRALPGIPGASLHYTAVVAKGFKDE